MKIRHIRLALGGLLLFGALFVVLPGVGRLFAQETPAPKPVAVRVYSAILTGAASGAQGEQAASERSDLRTDALWGEECSQYAAPRERTITDANGNVVTARAYYKSVPEAFAPGDAKT